MRILVINTGSSSVKIGVFEKGEHIFNHKLVGLSDLKDGLREVPSILRDHGYEHFDAIGHRIVHGGDVYRDACLIDHNVITTIKECISLAPLHNPSNLLGVHIAQHVWPDKPQIAVFDTAFHQSMPEKASTYPVPKVWRDLGFRRYGFHGISHKYVMLSVAKELRKHPEDLRIISCHLGNGASVCAINRGISVDTSMGLTPLEGLMMGTRSGDVDPGLFAFLYRTQGLLPDQIEEKLYLDSGMKALSGLSNDIRIVEKKAAQGDEHSQLALDVYTYRVIKYIGAYVAALGGLDVLAFTGGIGERSALIRECICKGFEFMNIQYDEKKNTQAKLKEHGLLQIQSDTSNVKVMVVMACEQWMIAKEVEDLLRK